MIGIGILIVAIGLMFFMEGLRLGMMPLGETIGAVLPRNSSLQLILAFAFLLGLGATFAEPAIDEIKGTTDWRDQGVSQLVGTGKSAGIGIFGKVKERTHLTNQCIVTVIVSRRHVDCVIDAALAAGAPGANISYAKLFEATATDDESRHGFRLNREHAVICLVLAEGLYATVSTAIQDAVDAHEIDEICFFRQPVTRAITYLPGTAEAPKTGVTT